MKESRKGARRWLSVTPITFLPGLRNCHVQQKIGPLPLISMVIAPARLRCCAQSEVFPNKLSREKITVKIL